MNDPSSTAWRPATLCLALVLCAAAVGPAGTAYAQIDFGGRSGNARAQQDTTRATEQAASLSADVPRIEEAEAIFRRGVSAFEEGNYGLAFERLQVAVNSYPLHQKTTAATLMAAKALYRQGQHARADELLSTFLREYPSSSYLEEARRVRRFARQELGIESAVEEVDVLQLGIALPLSEEDASLTQAMFNGIEQAVAEQNGGGPASVRMIFRDTQGSPEGAREALGLLAEEGADVVIGPLYSRTARPAGAVAEEERLPMVVPLATEQGVSQGRRYVFQANPTIAMRGRQMAVFAQQSMRRSRFGVISQPEGTLSHEMGESFREEVERQGGEVVFAADTLDGLRAWSRLNEAIPGSAMANAEVLYMPVSGGEAPRLVQAALTALDRANVPRLRVLGNGEWHDLPVEQAASRYQATYHNVFYVDPSDPEVQSFVERYREATGQTPDQLTSTGRRLAYTGYDVTHFLLEARRRSTDAASPPPLPEALRQVPPYEGLGMRIDFEGGNVNQALFFQRYRDGRVELLR